MDGIAASHLHGLAPATSRRKPSHCGNSQNHKAKKPLPTSREAIVASQRLPFSSAGSVGDCASAIGVFPKARVYCNLQAHSTGTKRTSAINRFDKLNLTFKVRRSTPAFQNQGIQSRRVAQLVEQPIRVIGRSAGSSPLVGSQIFDPCPPDLRRTLTQTCVSKNYRPEIRISSIASLILLCQRAQSPAGKGVPDKNDGNRRVSRGASSNRRQSAVAVEESRSRLR